MGYPYDFHVALDGNGLNGLDGLAGVCVFRYDPRTGDYAHKIVYYDGIAAGHAVSVDPTGTVGYLGNAGQHLLFYDASSLDEISRCSTFRYEVGDTTLRGSTHAVWLDARTVLVAIGDWFYRLDVERPDRAERVVQHGLGIVHAMKRTASGRYVVYGAMDHPTRGEACEVGVLDLVTGTARRIAMPTTCWHVVCHPVEDRFYGVSFRVYPDESGNYYDWTIAPYKEYAYEIDAASGEIVRHWTAGRQIPAHINSDMTISADELIFCNGASSTIVCIDLASFARYRVVDERPELRELFERPREVVGQVTEALGRASPFTSAHRFITAFGINRERVLDGVYGCQLSSDGKWLFTANRGLNRITVYDYPGLQEFSRVEMPDLGDYVPFIGVDDDQRLGFHHAHLVTRTSLPRTA